MLAAEKKEVDPPKVEDPANPESSDLPTGGTEQYAVYGRLSDGDSVSVDVTYTATGGTITAGGFYTAGGTSGSYRVIAEETESGLADTSTVTPCYPIVHVDDRASLAS